MSNRNTAIPAVYIILEREGRFLLARRCNTGYEDGNYQVPAGHVEDGELPTEAMAREAKEEVGVDVLPIDLTLVHVGYRPRHDATGNRVDFFFHASSWQGEVRNMESEKCDDLRWVTFEELPDNVTAHVREALEAWRNGVFFKELSVDFLKEEGLYRL